MNEQFHRLGKDGKKYWGKQGAGILFTDGKSILLLKRAKPSDHPYTWGPPGGKKKSGESDIDAARRESTEETGVPVQGTRFETFEDIDGRFRYICFLFMVDKMFNCKISKEHDDWKWVPIDQLDEYDLHPGFKNMLPSYKKAISRKFPTKNFADWIECR